MKPICIMPIYSQISDYPYKHALYLAGQPLFYHTINKAQQSQLFSEIIVITDNDIYADIAAKYQVTVYKHHQQALTEKILITQMIQQVLENYEPQQSFMVINPAAINLDISDLIDSYQLYTTSSAKKVQSVVQLSSATNQLLTLDNSKQIISQHDMTDCYYEVNAIMISDKTHYLVDTIITAYILDEQRSLVINSYQDFVHILGEKYFDYQLREQNGKTMFYQMYDDKLKQPVSDKVLLGDSRTVNIHLPGFKNFGLGGVTLATLMERIEDILTPQVKVALVSIGVNDFTTKYSFETIQDNFIKLIQLCKIKNIRLLLTTIPYTLYRHEVTNPPIQQMNEWLMIYCQQQDIPLLDLNKLLSVNDTLKYCYTYDGLHFTDEANRILEQQYQYFIQQNR